MLELLEFATGNFWKFVATVIILWVTIAAVLNLVEVCMLWSMTRKEGWTSVNKEDPQYYVPVLVKAVDVEGEFQAVAWRASDGDDSYYTIYRTQVIINGKVLAWKSLR